MPNNISSPRKRGIYFLLLLLSFFLLFKVKAQPVPIWGTATNGLQLGVSVTNGWGMDGRYDLFCEMNIRNAGTIKTVLRFPPVEHRYEIELRDPNGQQVNRATNNLVTALNSSRHPVSLNTNETSVVGYFYISDLFKVKTNGLHALIISERATTNYIRGKEPVYFLFPPVTNKFNISPEQI